MSWQFWFGIFCGLVAGATIAMICVSIVMTRIESR